MEWNLSAGNGAIVREVNFDRDVDEGVVVGMDVETDGVGEKSYRVEIEVELSQMLERNSAIRKRIGRILQDRNVLDLAVVPNFWADISNNVTGGKPPRYGERREKPSRLRKKIVRRDCV
jgi:hypothetical protein